MRLKKDCNFRRGRTIPTFRLSLLAITLSVIYSVQPAWSKAGAWSGADFLKYCISTDQNSRPKSQEENDRVLYCVGYLEASMVFLLAMDGKVVCLPKNLNPNAVVSQTASWLMAHPDQTQYLLGSSILAATQEKWPCSRR